GHVAGAHIDNFQRVDGCEVVAVCSRRLDRAQAKIASHSLLHAAAYDDVDDFLDHKGLDIVCIATPHHLHAEQTIAAAKAGKHVVIEKPVALKRKDLIRMVAAVKKAKVKTSVCFELHWIGSFQHTSALI